MIKETGYKRALQLASSHYENFPVVSILIPAALRKYVAIVYWFARTADDIADEDIRPQIEREKELDLFERRFLSTIAGEYTDELDAALHDAILQNKLTVSYFTDLISAFRQDIHVNRYSCLEELKDYCCRSANPVGRLMLELFRIKAPEAAVYSDKICTALQLTNFWQDISVDAVKNRIYIPGEYLRRYNITESEVLEPNPKESFADCVRELCSLTDEMFVHGSKLIYLLKGRFRYEIIWTILGGRKILAKIEKINYTSFNKRVKLSFFDIIVIFIRSFFYGRTVGTGNSKGK